MASDPPAHRRVPLPGVGRLKPRTSTAPHHSVLLQASSNSSSSCIGPDSTGECNRPRISCNLPVWTVDIRICVGRYLRLFLESLWRYRSSICIRLLQQLQVKALIVLRLVTPPLNRVQPIPEGRITLDSFRSVCCLR